MPTTQHAPLPLGHKILREVARPVRQLTGQRNKGVKAPTPTANAAVPPAAAPAAQGIMSFHPTDCTVEPEGVALVKELVRQSQQFDGPIIEVGTLLGITATHMALAKAPEQRIIAVDAFCWNPWGLTPDVHAALATQVLQYLISVGEVQLIRGDKNKFYEDYKGPAPAMVFLDAMHDYEETKKDIEWAQRIGAKIISGHDYCDKFPGVMQIVDECGGPRRLSGSVWAL
ncbi:class I SAM-dependent methyltransferase [Botrimarina hoheduenensis]|uniref:O-methyltransferase n=1 Tax=Botrimarina hoheduenensis TaxID=2528000 RepID=A0A5C5W939_9BACT|nr:class I SAM-dependent methyltransferase [Botrimarina hoheduenensis]TWT47398.1 hypothetical protein Pla111_10120 [Botrimarina hoheduenensis]